MRVFDTALLPRKASRSFFQLLLEKFTRNPRNPLCTTDPDSNTANTRVFSCLYGILSYLPFWLIHLTWFSENIWLQLWLVYCKITVNNQITLFDRLMDSFYLGTHLKDWKYEYTDWYERLSTYFCLLYWRVFLRIN